MSTSQTDRRVLTANGRLRNKTKTNRDLTAHLMDLEFARKQYNNQRRAIQAQKECNGLKKKKTQDAINSVMCYRKIFLMESTYIDNQ